MGWLFLLAELSESRSIRDIHEVAECLDSQEGKIRRARHGIDGNDLVTQKFH
jgi:hypothetical protein